MYVVYGSFDLQKVVFIQCLTKEKVSVSRV